MYNVQGVVISTSSTKRYGYGKKRAHAHTHNAAKRTFILCMFTVKSSSKVLLGRKVQVMK